MSDAGGVVDLTTLDPALGEWLQTTLAKGAGARVIALLQAIEDWMQVCHQQEAEIERLEGVLAELFGDLPGTGSNPEMGQR